MSQKKAKKPVVIKKPIYQGKIFEKTLLKRGAKVSGTMVVLLVLYLVFGPMLMMENQTLRILLNGMLFLAGGMLMMMSGTSDGESDAALGEIVYQRKEEGKSVTLEE